MSSLPLALTPGEPAGIGPELVIALAQAERGDSWFAVGSATLLAERAAQLELPLAIDDRIERPTRAAGALTVLDVPLQVPAVAGEPDRANAAATLAALDRAIDAVLAGTAAGLVTGPMQKSVLNDAGIPFSGHTEHLCARAGVDDVLMLLVADDLRVALATTHLPLRAVADAITPELLRRRLKILDAGLRARFGIASPRIGVAGLNPHAGEGGHLGTEEREIIEPTLRELRAAGMDLDGPVPADALFTHTRLEALDAVFAMYHDQGLPVLKHAGFGQAVNVTLGLPFVRTSVDHGTALDIAGTGRADTGSVACALTLARRLAG
ncbi:MAG: 4-hydroxythreonine-4-phosphate dehydrogenase PdxA [Pseudomonadota bacterium]